MSKTNGSSRLLDGVKVSFYIPKEWREEVQELSTRMHLSASDVYRMALREFLDKYEKADEGGEKA